MRQTRRSILLLSTVGLLSACSGGPESPPAPAAQLLAAAGGSTDWPQFALNARRSNASDAPTGIDAAHAASLQRHRVALPGTVDSSPIYLHDVKVAGRARNVFVVTTTYGRTLAIDAADGALLWQFVPPGIRSWEGSTQITTASPAADPARQALYAAAPDGVVRKLKLSDGRLEWEARVTRDPKHEKLASSLGVAGPSVLAATGGYLGDTPPYQGHLAEIARSSGRITALFNALCTNRQRLIKPASCSTSGAAIFARAGAVVEPATGRVLLATGNGPYDASKNFGDSVLELSPHSLRLRQAFTPLNQRQLAASDADVGSGGPILLPGGLVASGGKDGALRVLDLRQLNGHSASGPFRTGGSLQTLPLPGGAPIFSAGAVSHGRLFIASGGGTRAYSVNAHVGARSGTRLPRVGQARRGPLSVAWSADAHGTSPVLAGGLLYIYDPDAGKLNIYLPSNGARLASLPAGPGHWNSPVVAGSRVALPEGNANDHARSGTLDLYYVNG